MRTLFWVADLLWYLHTVEGVRGRALSYEVTESLPEVPTS